MSVRSGRPPRCRRALLAIGLTAVSCRPASKETAAPPAHGARYVKWLEDEAGVTAFYKTPTLLTDCPAQAAEMTTLWRMVVEPKLQGTHWSTLTLFPEEPSGRSASFTFTRDASGDWRADGPCRVRIPAEHLRP